MSFASLFPVFMFELVFHSILQWPVTQHKHRSSNSEHFISDLGNSVTYFTTKYITSWIFFTYIICLVKKFVYKVLSICYMPRETESSQKRHPLFHTPQLVFIFCIETETHYAPQGWLGTGYVSQVGLEFSCLCIPRARITAMHHDQLSIFFSFFVGL